MADTTASSSGHSLRYWQWRALLCVMGVYLFYYTGRMVIGHAIPLMEEDLGYTSEQLGWLTSALFATYGIGQAINGNLGDLLGGRRMMALGALLSMVFCWAFSFMHGLTVLVVFWATNGFVQSMGWAPGSRLISNWWPRRERGTAFGLYVLAAGFATMLVWGTSHVVLTVVGEGDPSRWRWLFRIPVLALGLAEVGTKVVLFAPGLLIPPAPVEVEDPYELPGETPAERAEAFVGLLDDGRFDDAWRTFTPEMAGALPAHELAMTWRSTEAVMGGFEGVSERRTGRQGGLDLVDLVADWGSRDMVVRVVLDDDRVTGLWFIAPEDALPPG